jgi:hypothetical protein
MMAEICDSVSPWLHLGLAFGFGIFTGVVLILAYGLRKTNEQADADDAETPLGIG